MSLANLLKKGSLRGLATATPATSATDRTVMTPCVATVATVAVADVPDRAMNDLPQVPDFVTGSAVSAAVTAETAVHKELVRSEVRTETAVSTSPDRWC